MATRVGQRRSRARAVAAAPRAGRRRARAGASTARAACAGLAGDADMRAVLARDDDDARLAIDVYVHRLRAAIAAMAAALGGLDALVFTGGVGEHAPEIRARAAARLGVPRRRARRERQRHARRPTREIGRPARGRARSSSPRARTSRSPARRDATRSQRTAAAVGSRTVAAGVPACRSPGLRAKGAAMEGSQRRQLLVSKRLDPGGRPGRPVRVLHPRPARLPHLHGPSAGARARRRPAGPRRSTPARTSPRASRSSCTTASWSTGRRSATAPTSGPDYTADYLRRAVGPRQARLRRRRVGLRGAPDDRGLPHQPLRQAHEDADAHRAAGRRRSARSSPYYSRFFSDPTTEHGLRPKRDHRPHAAAPADRVLRLDGVGGVDRTGPATTTPTPTTGRRSRASTTSRPPT